MRDSITERWRQAVKCSELARKLAEEIARYEKMAASDGRLVKGESVDGMKTWCATLTSQAAYNEAVLKRERNERNDAIYGSSPILRATFTDGRKSISVIIHRPDDEYDVPYIDMSTFEAISRLVNRDSMRVLQPFDVLVKASGGVIVKGTL